ncbi:hypothetical protein Gorai_017258, partial [Gossypium raimondii]|nr:hypothetical protein [Gossypium raimondii]
MENYIVGLTIQNEEENAWQISSNGDDPVSNFGLCLVGCFLTASVVPLCFAEFWVQIHDIPNGLFLEQMAKQFGELSGKFLDYDPKSIFLGLKQFLRVRVTLDALPRRALAPISAWLCDEGNRVEETQSDAPGPKVGVPATSYTSNIVNVISKNLGLHLDGVAPNLKEKDIEDVGDPQDAMDEMGLMHEERPLQLVNGNKRARVLSSVSIVSTDLDLEQALNNDESADSAWQGNRQLYLKLECPGSLRVVLRFQHTLKTCNPKDCSICLRTYSSFHINVDILDKVTGYNWRLIGFYGALEKSAQLDGLVVYVGERSSPRDKHTGTFRSSWVDGFSHYKFEAKWVYEQSCEDDNRCVWNTREGDVPYKLENLGTTLLDWWKTLSSNQKRIARIASAHLVELNNENPTKDILAKIVDVKLALNMEADKEKIYWEQRAHTNWLKEGTVTLLSFINLLPIDDVIDVCIIGRINDDLMAEFTTEEVQVAMFSMPPLKASG